MSTSTATMFANFDQIQHGESPIGCIPGTWGYRSGYWFLLNTNTAPIPKNFFFQPCNIPERMYLGGTLGRGCMEAALLFMCEFQQETENWRPMSEMDLAKIGGNYDFWIELGWLVKNPDGNYEFTLGLILLLMSRTAL